MKKVQYKKSFEKQFKKLTEKQKQEFYKRLKILLESPRTPSLRYHSLKGKYTWFKSINISGDIRAVLKEQWDTLIIFYMIDTHSELY